MSPKKQMAVWIAILTLTLGVGLATATNQGGCYKFADASIKWFNGATGDYFNIFEEEARTDANAWDPYTDIVFVPVAAAGSTDHINAYAKRYGNTGWVMLVSFSYSGCTSRKADIKLNQTYADGYGRNVRKAFACNGIGKSLGLTNNPSIPGCMDGTFANAFPSPHDRDMVNSIY